MPRILVVDDEADIRDSIADLLCAVGFDVVTAAHGGEALVYLRAPRHEIGLILLDLTMPEVDGWSFRREQLADGSIASIPVVIMSAVHDVRAAAASLSVTDFLVKPIELPSLLNLVQRYASL